VSIRDPEMLSEIVLTVLRAHPKELDAYRGVSAHAQGSMATKISSTLKLTFLLLTCCQIVLSFKITYRERSSSLDSSLAR
jgi:hypothetical protein